MYKSSLTFWTSLLPLKKTSAGYLKLQQGGTERHTSRRRSTWGASASLRDGELLVGGATITTGLPGKDGRLCQSLRGKQKFILGGG